MTDRELARLADAMRAQAESEVKRLRAALESIRDYDPWHIVNWFDGIGAVREIARAALAPAEPREWIAEDILKNEG